MSNFVGKRPNPLAAVIQGAVKLFGKKQKTTGTEVISSVPISKDVKKYGIKHSVAKTRLNESSNRSAQVDKNYKTMADAKKAFKGAKADLQKMVDTGRATKINKRVFRKGVKYDSDDLFPTKKKTENKAKGGRVGLKRGTGLMPKKKSNVDKIKKTFGPKSLGMQSVIYGLDKNPKITKADPKAKFIAAANKKKKKVI
jgi:hypothetical protein